MDSEPPRPHPSGRSTHDPGTRALWPAAIVTAIVTAIVLALWITWSPPGAHDITASEGYYGTQARGLLLDHRFPLSPPLRPMGEPGFKPPLYPALLAVSIHFLGANELAIRWPSLLLAALIAVSLAAMVARAA